MHISKKPNVFLQRISHLKHNVCTNTITWIMKEDVSFMQPPPWVHLLQPSPIVPSCNHEALL